MHLEFVVPGPPISNQSPGPNLSNWRARVAGEAQNQWATPLLTGDLKAIIINFYPEGKPSVDVDNMNTEQRLMRAAERYRVQGYQVVVRPGQDVLPPFAKDFNVEILATRADRNVLASAKKDSAELEADVNLPRYAEIIEKQPGWRFDIFVLGPDSDAWANKREDVQEPSDTDILRSLDDAERMLHAGFVAQSLIAAWAALESAMRRRLRAQGEEAGWGTSPRTMLNELLSAGDLANSVFRELEDLFQLRSAIVHGFAPPIVEKSAVELLVQMTKRLLTAPLPVKQTA